MAAEPQEQPLRVDPITGERYLLYEDLPQDQQARLAARLGDVLGHFENSEASQSLATATTSVTKQEDDTKDEAREELYAGATYTSLTKQDVGDIMTTFYPALVERHGADWTSVSLTGGLANSNYKVTSVRTQQSFLLKVWDEKTAEEIDIQLTALDVLHEHDFPTCYAIASAGPSPRITFQGKSVTLLDFLPGRNPPMASRLVMRQLGEALAQLHSIPTVEIPASLGPNPMGVVQMRPFLEAHKDYNHPFIGFLSSSLDALDEALNADLGTPEAMLHADLFLENCMFQEDDSFVAIIDFEEICRGAPLLDVAMTMLGCCYDKNNQFMPEAAMAFLVAYQNVRRLTGAEKRYLGAYIQYSALCIAFWRFRQFNIRRPDPQRKDAHEQMVERFRGQERIKFVVPC